LTLGSFCKIFRNSPNRCAACFHAKSCVFIFTRNGLGYILGNFFTNASGRPVRQPVNPAAASTVMSAKTNPT
jgi:hypothetical protein